MKKISIALLFSVLLFGALTSCKKSSNTNNEAGLTATTTPANNSNNLNILGPTFPLTVEITSTMPPSGVKIAITATVDGSSASAFFTSTNTTTAQQNNYTITNTPAGVTCLVNITITSVTKSSNVWMGSYRYSMK